MFVDRGGVKIALQESYSRNSKGSFGLVLERVCGLSLSNHHHLQCLAVPPKTPHHALPLLA